METHENKFLTIFPRRMNRLETLGPPRCLKATSELRRVSGNRGDRLWFRESEGHFQANPQLLDDGKCESAALMDLHAKLNHSDQPTIP